MALRSDRLCDGESHPGRAEPRHLLQLVPHPAQDGRLEGLTRPYLLRRADRHATRRFVKSPSRRGAHHALGFGAAARINCISAWRRSSAYRSTPKGLRHGASDPAERTEREFHHDDGAREEPDALSIDPFRIAPGLHGNAIGVSRADQSSPLEPGEGLQVQTSGPSVTPGPADSMSPICGQRCRACHLRSGQRCSIEAPNAARAGSRCCVI